MKRTHLTILVIIVALAAAGVFLIFMPPRKDNVFGSSNNASPTTSGRRITMAGGRVSFSYTSDFSLAIKPEQVLVRPYIPPCDTNFDYCLYYNGSDYKGTNFESAALRTKARADLPTKTACVTTPPDGFTNFQRKTADQGVYATSVFPPLGGAALGHHANGALSRFWYDGRCYEFETRISESQFANYPVGTIREFTAADKDHVESQLRQILDRVALAPRGLKVIFPAP